MLKALLRDRLHDHALLFEEDAFTSAVFERFAYLSPGVAWKILALSCEGTLPALPLKEPVWHFWPRWDAEPGPDVVIEFPDLALLFARAKSPEAWQRLIDSAPFKPPRMVGVSLGAPVAGFARLAWERIPQATENVRRSGHLHAGHVEVLRDIDTMLAMRGHRTRTSLSTLPAVTVRLPNTTPQAITEWKVRP